MLSWASQLRAGRKSAVPSTSPGAGSNEWTEAMKEAQILGAEGIEVATVLLLATHPSVFPLRRRKASVREWRIHWSAHLRKKGPFPSTRGCNQPWHP